MKEKNNQLTSGSVSQGIIRFALPLLGANIVQQLYNTVDLMFVG
jgi:Na+-driven multidrug efflux pump